MPYDGYLAESFCSAQLLEKLILDSSSGVDKPAVIVLETVQGEGGLNSCSKEWLGKIHSIASEYGIILIVDEIQTGCGRLGSFFPCEQYGIQPDIIVLSKSISGYGLPMSLLVMKRELDVWEPGEHNGTFRGNCHAFVTASAALRYFWVDGRLLEVINRNAGIINNALLEVSNQYGPVVKGRGCMQGIDFGMSSIAKKIQTKCFQKGLIAEVCGPNGEVLKLLPALNISTATLKEGLAILKESIDEVFQGEVISNEKKKY